MRRILMFVLVSTLLAVNGLAQETQPNPRPQEPQEKSGAKAQASGGAQTSASAQAGPNTVNLASGTTFEVALAGPVDARKNKEGDQVAARATQNVKSDGKVVIPKGSRLLGHVTQAQARGQGESNSSLGLVFDRAVLKNGQEVPVHVVIQALAAAQTTASSSLGETEAVGQASGMGSARASGGGGGGGGLVGGATGAVANTTGAVGSTVGGAVNTTTSTAASTAGAVSGRGAGLGGALSSNSTGVIGLSGLSLNSQAANATQGSVILSSTKNVHLDSGTRLLLRAANQ